MKMSARTACVATSSLILGLAFMSPAAASGGLHRSIVVHPGESIQKAVDAAHPGDTVVVKAGTYTESVGIQKDGLTLRADGTVTIKPPATPGGCSAPGEEIGICVVPADIQDDGSYTNRVRNVTVTGFRVEGFQGNGVFGYGTDHLQVSRVRATGNASYGIVNFDGRFTSFTDNAASGAGDAGIYVGDAPDAQSTIKDNSVWDSTFGILSRHTHRVTIADNTVWGNCLGIFVWNDGQPEGSGDNVVRRNEVRGNNKQCPGFPTEGVPAFGGGGIVLSGSQQNRVVDNEVTGNRGTSMWSGGIVLVVGSGPTFQGSSFNVISDNELGRNKPADIIADEVSVNNSFVNNECRTSTPSGLCEAH
jgi:nitrous oxidase accessory protein NosD